MIHYYRFENNSFILDISSMLHIRNPSKSLLKKKVLKSRRNLLDSICQPKLRIHSTLWSCQLMFDRHCIFLVMLMVLSELTLSDVWILVCSQNGNLNCLAQQH